MGVRATFKDEPVVLLEHIGDYYNALRLSTQEVIWIKDNSQYLKLADNGRCLGIKRIGNELYQCKLDAYHGGNCEF